MSGETQYTVAREFGYPKKLIKEFMQKRRYPNAGELIEDLEEYLLTTINERDGADESEEDESASDEEKVAAAAAVPMEGTCAVSTKKPLSLLEETELLYRKSLCMLCRKNKRCFVTLPCSHLTLCRVCLPKTRQCPRQDCQEIIQCVIATYLA